MSEKQKLPALNDLISDSKAAFKDDQFNLLLNQDPPKQWLKVNTYAKNSLYLPIDKVEFLLRKIFKDFKVEILGQGVAFNGVWVSIRLHYLHPVKNEWRFHDGIGAKELQVSKGKSPAELEHINSGALAMAFPIAKSTAIKDAADHLGKLFGGDLNRKDVVNYAADKDLAERETLTLEQLTEKFNSAKASLPAEIKENIERIINNKEENNYWKAWKTL